MFTSPEPLNLYLEQERADVLLVGEGCRYETERAAKKILLTEENGEERDLPWVFKYQSAGNIMREITAYTTGEKEWEDRETPEIYTVFATRAGQERSGFARQLTNRLQEQGEVLYINLDLFPAEESGEGEDWKGMSEAVYYLKQGGDQIRWKIKALIGEQQGIKQIRPVHCSMDLMELTPEDAGLFFRVLREMQEFRYMVLEVGFYNETMLEICRLSHRICLVTPEEEDYIKSSEAFLKQLTLMQRGGIERKVEIVRYGGTDGERASGSLRRGKPGRSVAAGDSGRTGLFSGMER